MIKKDLKIGLTLSGGGVRAAVFHLGVLARLAEENLLEQVTMISTVSGGSLVTGIIYTANNNKWPTSAEFKEKCIPEVKKCLTTRSLQGNALARLILWPWPIIWRGRASIFSAAMQACWGIKASLASISGSPEWNINATTIESGKSWRFVPGKRMGDYLLNYTEKPDLKLSEALCSSAAVPLLIGFFKIRTKNYKWYKFLPDKTTEACKPEFSTLRIWDGGAYDNLGVEPFFKYGAGLSYTKKINFLMVSDAALEIETKERKWYSTNAMRLLDVTSDQVRALRARALWNHFDTNPDSGTYMKIGETAGTIKASHKSQATVSSRNFPAARLKELKFYPTNLKKMTEADFDDLYRHGWEVANASLVCRCPDVFADHK